MNFKKVFNNPIVFYMSTRYVTYGIQFVTSLLIAVKLGPFYMGVWGGILLILNYFQQVNFGISHSFNILYVLNRNNNDKCRKYYNNSIILLTYLSILSVIVYGLLSFFRKDFFTNLFIDKYFIGICIIGILQYFYQLVINLYRLKNKVGLVAFSQSLLVILTFSSVLLFTGKHLISALIFSYIIAYSAVILSGKFRNIYPSFYIKDQSSIIQKEILFKGWYLFLYNSCFYFIIITIRTIIGGNYSVEEFGVFTFSYTLAHSIMLLLESVQFLLFPKIIGRLSDSDNFVVVNSLTRYRYLYITLAHLLIYLAIFVFPLFLYFLPSYNGAQKVLNLIALTVLMNANSIGYSELLQAKNKERVSAIISIVTLIVNIALSYILTSILHVSFSYVILATLISYTLFSVLIYVCAMKSIETKTIRLLDLFPLRLIVPYILALALAILTDDKRLSFIPLLVFLIINFRDLKNIVMEIRSILFTPRMLNL